MLKNNRTLNLSLTKELTNSSHPEEIQTLNTVKEFIQYRLKNISSSENLNSLKQSIDILIKAEDAAINGGVDSKRVAVLVDTDHCDKKSLVALNTFYQTFDANNLAFFKYFNDFMKISQSLTFPDYDFCQVVIKCLCTINTRLGPLHSCPSMMSEEEYYAQDFTALLEQLVREEEFTIEVDGVPHDIVSNLEGWVTVDGEKIAKISEASENTSTIMTAIYLHQPTTLH